ncbi:MAG: hypothetical protein ABFS02_03955, partial [Pseudomonadota bacterium]
MPDTTITIQRSTFNIMCLAIALLAIAFLTTWHLLSKCQEEPPPIAETPETDGGLINDGVRAPIDDELKEFARRFNYSTIRFTNQDGAVKIVGLDGKDIEVCGVSKGIEVPESCGLKDIELLTFVDQSRLRFRGSDCVTEKVGNAFITYHT